MKLSKRARLIWAVLAILMILSLVIAPFVVLLNAI